MTHRSVTYTATGHVDNTLKSLFIVGIDSETEIGYEVLDFHALIEGKSTVDAIGYVALTEDFLEHTTLRMGAIEHCHVTVGHTIYVV
jgi:hypothetical protein